MSKVVIFSETCKGVEDCGICAFVCPKNLFDSSEEMNEAGYLPPIINDEKECTDCMNCMISCPDFAIVVEKDSEGESEKGVDRDA